ncbi:sensor histidine kinase [Natronomonas sp. EA1]|uniref:sensor histidine kinase n=1 Tax=Natronomonas sp. EA1 TaxID=3421655 RepID=UPI003EB7B466
MTRDTAMWGKSLRVRTPTRIVTAYLAVGLLWLLTSDAIVAAVVPPSAQPTVQLWKGVAFVGFTAIVLYLLLSHDIAQREQYEQRLQWNLQQVSVLQRVMRHDIRTVSNILLGYAELLDDDVPPECRPYVNTIIEQSERLVRLSEKTSRMTRDRGPSDGDDLATFIEALRVDLRERFPEATIQLDLQRSPPVVSARAETIAVELLENAAKHGQEGVEITVRLRTDSDQLRLTIEDDGPGLPQLERTVLGQELEDPLSHSRGVGLWIVRLLVADRDGTFSVEEREPTGTCVSVSLPRTERAGAPSGNPLIHGTQARA